MKSINRWKRIAAVIGFFLGTGLWAQADWTRSGSTITDANGWVLKVNTTTINGIAGLSLPTDAVTTKGTPTGVLDLSGAISDGSVIVELYDYALRSSSAGTLYSVTLPSTVIRLGGNLFSGQSSLTNVVPLLPPSVKLIGDRPFYQVPVRGALDLTSVTNITGGSNFRSTKITSVVFGPGLQTIPAYAFESDTTLGSVTFADGLQIIGDHAFSSCTSLTNIVNALPHTVTSLGSGQVMTFGSVPYTGCVELVNAAFSNVPQQFWSSGKVTNFVFGIGLTNIEDYAFDSIGNNSRAWDIHFRGSVPVFATVKSQIFRGTSDWKLRVCYPFYDDAPGGWREWVAANTTPLTTAQTNTYVAAYPGEPLPVGYGKSGTIFANEYLVSWAPPALATNALHVVGSLTRSISGAGEPARDAVDPSYGVVENLADSATVPCSAPAATIVNGIKYQCAGYVLEALGADGWQSPVTNLASTSFTYTQSGSAAARLTWLWEPIGYRLTLTMPDLGADSVTRSVAADADGIYPAGTSVQLTANASSAAPSAVFRRWYGDVPVGQDPASATITVVMDGVKALIPEFVRDWMYTDAATDTIRDGYWTLKVTANGSVLTTSSHCYESGGATSPLFSLDLSKPISDDRTLGVLGGASFENCTAVTNVVLPSTLQTLAGNAFYGCGNLVSVTPFLPDSVVAFSGTQVFLGCSKLTGDLRCVHVSNIVGKAFNGTKITSAYLPVATNINSQAFLNCSSLTNVVLSDSLTTLGYESFHGCSGLVSVSPFLPDSLTSLDKAFQGCSKLAGDVRCVRVPMIVGSTFSGDSKLSSADLPMATNIGSQAFLNCSSLTNVVFSESLTAIANEGFYGCSTLGRVFFQGDVPSFTRPFTGINAYVMRIYAPKWNASWEAFAATGTVALTSSETNTFQSAYPGEPLPIGTWTPPSGGNKQWLCIWVTPKDAKRGTAIYLK